MQGSMEDVDTTIHLSQVSSHGLVVNAFIFLPPLNKEVAPVLAAFTHGYTSHKGSILNWGGRLAEMGIPTVIFDLPGHYIGSFHSLESFESFRDHAHELFIDAFAKLKNVFKDQFPLEENKFAEKGPTYIFGGHSLGALLALKATALPEFAGRKKLTIAVGLGMGPTSGDKAHIFETEFYKKTLNIRQQLVASELGPEKVFPWIKSEKEKLKIRGEKVFLLTGEDDVVSPPKKVHEMADKLIQQKNAVSVFISKRLSHHQPELAASPICKYIRDQGYLVQS